MRTTVVPVFESDLLFLLENIRQIQSLRCNASGNFCAMPFTAPCGHVADYSFIANNPEDSFPCPCPTCKKTTTRDDWRTDLSALCIQQNLLKANYLVATRDLPFDADALAILIDKGQLNRELSKALAEIIKKAPSHLNERLLREPYTGKTVQQMLEETAVGQELLRRIADNNTLPAHTSAAQSDPNRLRRADIQSVDLYQTPIKGYGEYTLPSNYQTAKPFCRGHGDDGQKLIEAILHHGEKTIPAIVKRIPLESDTREAPSLADVECGNFFNIRSQMKGKINGIQETTSDRTKLDALRELQNTTRLAETGHAPDIVGTWITKEEVDERMIDVLYMAFNKEPYIRNLEALESPLFPDQKKRFLFIKSMFEESRLLLEKNYLHREVIPTYMAVKNGELINGEPINAEPILLNWRSGVAVNKTTGNCAATSAAIGALQYATPWKLEELETLGDDWPSGVSREQSNLEIFADQIWALVLTWVELIERKPLFNSNFPTPEAVLLTQNHIFAEKSWGEGLPSGVRSYLERRIKQLNRFSKYYANVCSSDGVINEEIKKELDAIAALLECKTPESLIQTMMWIVFHSGLFSDIEIPEREPPEPQEQGIRPAPKERLAMIKKEVGIIAEKPLSKRFRDWLDNATVPVAPPRSTVTQQVHSNYKSYEEYLAERDKLLAEQEREKVARQKELDAFCEKLRLFTTTIRKSPEIINEGDSFNRHRLLLDNFAQEFPVSSHDGILFGELFKLTSSRPVCKLIENDLQNPKILRLYFDFILKYHPGNAYQLYIWLDKIKPYLSITALQNVLIQKDNPQADSFIVSLLKNFEQEKDSKLAMHYLISALFDAGTLSNDMAELSKSIGKLIDVVNSENSISPETRKQFLGLLVEKLLQNIVIFDKDLPPRCNVEWLMSSVLQKLAEQPEHSHYIQTVMQLVLKYNSVTELTTFLDTLKNAPWCTPDRLELFLATFDRPFASSLNKDPRDPSYWALTPLVLQVALRSPEKIKNFLQLLYKDGMAAVDAVTQEQEARVTQKAVYYQKLWNVMSYIIDHTAREKSIPTETLHTFLTEVHAAITACETMPDARKNRIDEFCLILRNKLPSQGAAFFAPSNNIIREFLNKVQGAHSAPLSRPHLVN